MQKKAFLKIRQIRIEFPDAIVGLARLEPVTEGWVVKIKDAQNFEGNEGMDKAVSIALDTTETVAGWTDGESEIWDVVQIFEDEDEATAAGIENEQMTIYQIETGRLKWID